MNTRTVHEVNPSPVLALQARLGPKGSRAPALRSDLTFSSPPTRPCQECPPHARDTEPNALSHLRALFCSAAYDNPTTNRKAPTGRTITSKQLA